MDAVLVDYVQRIAKSEKADRRDIEISHIGRSLKTLAVEVSIPVICGAQINRDAIPKTLKDAVSEAENYGTAMSAIRGARPELHNLREGGAEQEADLVLGLLNYAADYRTEAKKAELPDVTLLEIGTLKNRVGEVGRWCQLAYEARFGLVRDPEPNEEKDLHVEASSSQYGRIREENLNKRSADATERAKLRRETEEKRLERERLRNERVPKMRKPKAEDPE
ncbi:MAG: Replicative DNA helicase [Candidatus Aminicenantes bacterium ADurb.Bin508]|nr:MAG: Replicative DNA helicase [Candidatus Aminicenantes bacterium ADurb.Bin508]